MSAPLVALLAARAFACGNAASLVPASAAPKKLLDYHAYSAWRQIRDVRLTRDGRRLAYAQVAAEADGELLVRDLGATAVFRAPRGRGPQFSPDGRFVVYRISAPVADVKAAEKAAKPPDQRPKDGLGIADLADVANARTTTVERVRSFALARDGTTLAYLLEPSPSPSPSASPARDAASPQPSASPSRPRRRRRAAVAVAASRGGRVAARLRRRRPRARRARRKRRARTRRRRSRSAGSATPTRRASRTCRRTRSARTARTSRTS